MEKEYKETDVKIKKLIDEEYKNNKKTRIVKDIIDEKVKVTTTEKSTLPLVEENNSFIEPANQKHNTFKYIIYIGILSAIILIVYIFIRKKKEV